MNKNQRQSIILEIIAEGEVDTQEMLLEKLKEKGIISTQATVSRDIRELGLVKATLSKGKRALVQSSVQSARKTTGTTSYERMLRDAIVSFEAAGNLIVIKTVAGTAMAVGAAIDHIEIEGIAGCIAGDDTLFAAVRNNTMVESVMAELRSLTETDRTE